MSSSPYIAPQLKQYIRKYDLQKLINTSFNSLLHKKPNDPYSYLIGLFQQHASSQIQIKNIVAYQIISGEGFPIIKLQIKANYFNQDKDFGLGDGFGILADDAVQYQADKSNGKGLGKIVGQIQEAKGKIVGYRCSNQVEIDKILQTVYNQKGASWLHTVNTLSYSIPKIQAHLLNKPLFSIISQLAQNKPASNSHLAPLVVHCLQGGKAIGSKCKVFKYMIISKQDYKDPYVAQIILSNIRKTIVSGKGGQAALKFSNDGTFVCPVDTILDGLKIVEQAINAANARDMFGIGLSWAADTLFAADTKKYQSQNPKTPFDNDQMIDYLIKLCTDKPIITALEDPLASTQLASWKKLKTKLSENQALKHIKIGSRNQKLLPITINPFNQQNIKNILSNLSIPATNDSHPDLTPQQITQHNANKFSLDFYQFRLFQLKTLSNVIKLSKILQKTNTKLILQDNLYQTYDTSIIDVAYGLGAIAGMGSINGNKFDRFCKLNRIKQISLITQNSSTEQKNECK